MGGLVEGGAGEFDAAAADLALDVGLAGLVARRRQPQMRPHRLRRAEPLRPVDHGAEGERGDRPWSRVIMPNLRALVHGS